MIPTKKRIAVLENSLLATYSIRAGLMEGLKAEGFDVFVITHPHPMKGEVEKKGIKVVEVPASDQNPLSIISYMFQVHRALRSIRPAVCLTYTVRPNLWGNIVAAYLKIRTVSNVTGTGPLFESKAFMYRVVRFLYPFVFKLPHRIFFQNYDDLNMFVKKGFVKKEKVARIPGSGVDYAHYSPRPKVANGVFSFLFISRLIKDKGILEYVEAARILKKKGLPVECRVLGPLWAQNVKSLAVSKEELDAWVEEGVIVYLGESSDVRDQIGQVDCVVLPSYREGTSNVLLEASSMAKPCVTTNVTGCRDIVEDGVTGYLANVQDGADLAEKMSMMYSLPETTRKEMGDAGRRKVIAEYAKEIVIAAYLKEIREILSVERMHSVNIQSS